MKKILLILMSVILLSSFVVAWNFEDLTPQNNIYILNSTNLTHNDIPGLQGGVADEYFHIRESWYNEFVSDIFDWITLAEATIINDSVTNTIISNNDSVTNAIADIGIYDDAWINQTIAVNISLVNTSVNNWITENNNSNNNYIFDVNTSNNNWIIENNNSVNNNIESKLVVTYHNATQSQAVAGTIDGGFLNYTQHSDGNYDGKTFNFSEASGSPGLDLRINYTGIDDFSNGVTRYKTSSLAGEYPVIQLWNYDEAIWEDYPVLGESISFATITQPVFDSSEHISGNIVQMRLYKSSNGNTNNHYYIDWLAISDGPGTPSGEETDPFSIHRDGAIPLTDNWNAGGFNISSTGNVTADYFFGNGIMDYIGIVSNPTMLRIGSSGIGIEEDALGDARFYSTFGTFDVIKAMSSASTGNFLEMIDLSLDTIFNVDGFGNLITVGNVTADYFFGNGSQLTDISTYDDGWINNTINVNITLVNTSMKNYVDDTFLTALVDDTTPELGGNLDNNDFNITETDCIIFESGGMICSGV